MFCVVLEPYRFQQKAQGNLTVAQKCLCMQSGQQHIRSFSAVLCCHHTQETMNACVELHHRLIRDLLRQHCGYESATEGDSFIAAFHSPTDALAFSTALQLALRNAHWPQGLLDHTSAAPVWAVQVRPDTNQPNVFYGCLSCSPRLRCLCCTQLADFDI